MHEAALTCVDVCVVHSLYLSTPFKTTSDLQVLFKMLNSGVFSEINGCISTGKEANVYHACTSDGTDLAIKVYKTSILVFKDRDRWAQVAKRKALT